MRLIASLFVVLLFSLSSCKFVRDKGWFGKKGADTLVVWQARQDSIRVADSVTAEIQKMKQIEKARLDALKLAEEERLAWEAKYKYHIIVGSFLTPEYAEKHEALYRSRGYDASIVPDSRDRFKLVSAEVHESLSKAYKRLKQFQDTVEFESWIYVKN